ncbi:MAG: amidohydrolase family protein [Candidatus Eremiobacteraeota bacterium]|nr:amidohydrolase family protein [Candidatus Eremiobacteraeota bacterium]
MTVTPGFIDVHSHADFGPFLHDDDTTKVLQGVTTEVVGNCGISLAPTTSERRTLLASAFEPRLSELEPSDGSFAQYLAAMDERGYVTNFAPLVGHNTLRIAALGMEAREPTDDELAQMGKMLEEALDAGAFGLSTGLIYPPGTFSVTSEIVALAERLRPNTLYTSHLRSEADALLEAVAEALHVGESTGTRVQISHHKAAGRSNWGKTRESLALIAAARARGVDVHQDVYPYLAGSTSLRAALPPEFHAGGAEATLARLRDDTALSKLAARIADGAPGFENLVKQAGYDGILIATTASGRFEGMTLSEVGHELAVDPFHALVHVLVQERLEATMTIFLMNEGDVERVITDAHTAIGSDGAYAGSGGKPHPRLFGTFPRVLARYVRERRTLSLGAAIHKMTALAAHIFRLPDRGTLAAGQIADIVAFDADTISDDLDYRDPVRAPKGIAWVMQGGRTVVQGHSYIGARNGERLRPAPA